MTEKRTITKLTSNEVCVNVKLFVTIDGQEYPVDKVQNNVYFNSDVGREELLASDESQEIINAIMALWGDEPTLKPVEE